MNLRRILAVATVSTVAAGAAVASSPAQESPGTAAQKCSIKGLRFEQTSGSSTQSVKVTKVTALNFAKCAKARSIAKVVAKDLLKETDVPATVKGYTVDVKEPCAGCPPVYKVTASKGNKGAKIVIKGGA